MFRHGHVLRPIGALLIAVALATAGCTSNPTPPVVEEAAAGSVRLDEVTVQRFHYPTADRPDTIRAGITQLDTTRADTDRNWADLYLPAGDQHEDTTPLAVLIHGGTPQNRLGASTFDPLARELAGRGMAVYNIEYRQSGPGDGWTTTFRDVASALDHVVEVDRRHPQITTDDELVVGHGAGAQLAAWAGTRHRLRDDEVGAKPAFRPTRVMSIAGPLDMVYAASTGDDRIVTALGGTPDQVPDRYEMVDPIQNIDPDTPVLAVHGSDDRTVSPDNSTRYIDAMRRAGGDGHVLLLDGEDHVSVISADSPAHRRIVDMITFASDAKIHGHAP